MKSKMKTILSLALILALALTCLAGCGSTSAPADQGESSGKSDQPPAAGTAGSTEPEGAVKKDTLIVAWAGEPPTLNHLNHNAAYAELADVMLRDGLFRLNPDGTVSNAVCESYENASDTEWIFHLKQGITFHDGTDLTAEDVVASLLATKASPTVGQYAAGIESAEAVDDYTVKVTTPGPYSNLINDLALSANGIVPSEKLAEGWDFDNQPIGCGPYELVEWKHGDSLTFKAFENYYDPEYAAKIPNLIIKVMTESSSRTIALEAGEVDFVETVGTSDIATLEANENVTVLAGETDRTWKICVNCEKYPFNNVDFRRALAAALNQQDVIDGALNGYGCLSYTQTALNIYGSNPEGAVTYDMDAAKAYLEASGVPEEDWHFTILVEAEFKKTCAEIAQNSWAQLGIDVTVEQVDNATLLDRSTTGNFDASIINFAPKNMMQVLNLCYDSAAIGGANKQRLNDPEVDEMIDRAAQCLDEAEREEILKELNYKLNTLSSTIPVAGVIAYVAYDKDLQGVELTYTGTVYLNKMYW